MSVAPDIFRFRTAPVVSAPESIDADKGVIRGVSAMQAVEALGHGMTIDAATLDQVAKLGNAAIGKGIKVRFGHPGACDNALGTLVGHATNFRVVGDKVLNDITLSESASVSPKGNLRGYLLKLAQENPRDFGMSAVIKAKRAWKLATGGEAISDKRPENAVGDLPFARVQELKAVDFVDEPAANRDGLFADADLVAAFSGTSADAEETFAAIDDLRSRMNLSVDAVAAFAARYVAARTTTTRTSTMKLSAAELQTLLREHKAHADLILSLANPAEGDGADLATIKQAIITADGAAKDGQIATLGAKVTDLEAKLAAAIADKAAVQAKHDRLAALKAGGDKDPGGSPTETDPEAVLKAEWDGFDDATRKGHGGEFAYFRAYALNERAKAKKA
jgi:hypothetical protein